MNSKANVSPIRESGSAKILTELQLENQRLRDYIHFLEMQIELQHKARPWILWLLIGLAIGGFFGVISADYRADSMERAAMERRN